MRDLENFFTASDQETTIGHPTQFKNVTDQRNYISIDKANLLLRAYIQEHGKVVYNYRNKLIGWYDHELSGPPIGSLGQTHTAILIGEKEIK